MGNNHSKSRWDSEKECRHDQRDQEEALEELDEYIRVTSPGTFAVILSLLILLVAAIVWGLVGTLPVMETVTGLVVDTSLYDEYPVMIKGETPVNEEDGEILVLCFVDASRYNGQAISEFGDHASLMMPDQNQFTGTIEECLRIPISREEAKILLFDDDWVTDECVSQDYNWLLKIRPDEDLSKYTFTLAEVTILTEEVAPIRFLMR